MSPKALFKVHPRLLQMGNFEAKVLENLEDVAEGCIVSRKAYIYASCPLEGQARVEG